MSRLKYSISILLLTLALISCKSSKEFTGFSYDPPDVTNTEDKEIEIQPRRTIGVNEPKVWISNEFEGARANDFYMVNDSTYEIYIKPENYPINNSPWYAFKIWSDTSKMVTIRMNYFEANHRYVPKISVQGNEENRQRVQFEAPVRFDTVNGTAVFDLLISDEPLIVSGQPLNTSSDLIPELRKRNILGPDFVEISEAGLSKEGRSIWKLTIDETENETAPVLAIIGRQHPPEVTGYLASLYFLEEFTADHDLAKEFRKKFVITALPMINPDGADMGHWRHNAAGVDLNRDWKKFNQPETRVVRDTFTKIDQEPERKLYYAIDFHSTNENIFYPIDLEVQTNPDNVTQQWIQEIIEENLSVMFTVEEFDTSSPIAKNWFYQEFGIDAVTYEVDDRLEDEKLEEVSRSAAKLLMRNLLKKSEVLDN